MDPYSRHGPNLENSSKYPYLIAPADDADLPRVCKALRIYNPNADVATIHLTSAGGSEVTLTIPAAAIWIEDIVTAKVFVTGTTPELVIHGYSD